MNKNSYYSNYNKAIMKLKTLLLTGIFLVIATTNTHSHNVANIGLSTGALSASLLCNSIWIKELITLRNSRTPINFTFLMGGLCNLYSTYRMFNDDLDNKPNKLFKNLMQQVKTRLPKSKLNEQK